MEYHFNSKLISKTEEGFITGFKKTKSGKTLIVLLHHYKCSVNQENMELVRKSLPIGIQVVATVGQIFESLLSFSEIKSFKFVNFSLIWDQYSLKKIHLKQERTNETFTIRSAFLAEDIDSSQLSSLMEKDQSDFWHPSLLYPIVYSKEKDVDLILQFLQIPCCRFHHLDCHNWYEAYPVFNADRFVTSKGSMISGFYQYFHYMQQNTDDRVVFAYS